MYRIRFHGRGGQGMKTASRILGTAFFIEGFEVQDAPLYGAERRGAPLFAYVRAGREAINERGIIRRPDLVVVADDTLVPVPVAGVMRGVTKDTVLLINSDVEPDRWRERLNFAGTVVTLPVVEVEDAREVKFIGAVCAAAAAVLVGVISKGSLERAIGEEIGPLGPALVQKNRDEASEAFALMAGRAGSVKEGGVVGAEKYEPPEWIDLPFEGGGVSAPAIHAPATSEQMETGLWRTVRPVIDYDICNRCWWLCSTFCPDGAINVSEEGTPEIDYKHCKGCMICMAQCPPHAITAIPEQRKKGGAR
jgi:pyruvate ferredoxin oxidoreductase gamma subunit